MDWTVTTVMPPVHPPTAQADWDALAACALLIPGTLVLADPLRPTLTWPVTADTALQAASRIADTLASQHLTAATTTVTPA